MSSLFRCLLLAFGAVAINGSPTQRQGAKPRSCQVPLTRDLTFGFLGNVSIGTPAQQITAFIDWTWISMYLISTTCAGKPGDSKTCLSPQQPLYNQSLSTSYKNQSSQYASRTWNPNEFFGTYDFTVDYGTDIQTVGASSSQIVLQTSDLAPGLFTTTVFPFSGIFGLSPVFKTDDPSTQSPFYQMWKSGAFPTPYAAFVYCYKEPKTLCQGFDGLQSLGGYDKDLAGKGLTWYPIVDVPEVNAVDFPFAPGVYNYWSIRVTQLSLDDEVETLNTTQGAGAAAIFDYASRGRGAPLSTNAYNKLVARSNATAITLKYPPNNGMQAFYQIDCSMTCSLPTIKYQFGGNKKRWKIVPENYVEEVSAGVCVLNVRTVGFGDFQLGNFGETFMKDKYVVFDFDTNRVGLAEIDY